MGEKGIEMMETDNPFEKVLDRLREKGWRKGDYGPKSGPNCIVGGLLEITGMTIRESYLSPEKVMLDSIVTEQFWERAVRGRMTHIPNFNDHPDTTFSDVEKVLEKAAVKWEEERVLRND